MKKLALLILLNISAGQALANEAIEVDRTRYIRPCRSWSYAPNTGGYVCNSTDIAFQVLEAYDVERYIEDLQRQIDALESRVRALESAKTSD